MYRDFWGLGSDNIFFGAFELKASSVRKRLDKVFNCNEIPLPLLNSAHQSRLMMVMIMRKREMKRKRGRNWSNSGS